MNEVTSLGREMALNIVLVEIRGKGLDSENKMMEVGSITGIDFVDFIDFL